MTLLAHKFVSVIADTADPTEVQPSNWNDDHVFGGGTTGSILCRDTAVANYGASWVASAAVGQVFCSAGAGVLPAWSASPTLTLVTTGAVAFSGDNAGDVGAVANRARSVYAGTALVVGTSPATTGHVRLPALGSIVARNELNTGDVTIMQMASSDRIFFGGGGNFQISIDPGTNDILWAKPLVALGGGAAPTLGTIGGSGPVTAAQNTWLRMKDSGGAIIWLPVWK